MNRMLSVQIHPVFVSHCPCWVTEVPGRSLLSRQEDRNRTWQQTFRLVDRFQLPGFCSTLTGKQHFQPFPFPSEAEPVCSGSFHNSGKSISKPWKQSKCIEENAKHANLDFPEQHIWNGSKTWFLHLWGSIINQKPANTDTSLHHRNYTC